VATPFGLNAAVLPLGKRLDPYLGVNFLVEIEGLIVAASPRSTASSRRSRPRTTARWPQRLRPQDPQGHDVWPTRAEPRADRHRLAVAWHERTRRGVVERKNGTIMLLDAQRVPVTWWNFASALPTKWTGRRSMPAARPGGDRARRADPSRITKPELGPLVSGARTGALAEAGHDVAGEHRCAAGRAAGARRRARPDRTQLRGGSSTRSRRWPGGCRCSRGSRGGPSCPPRDDADRARAARGTGARERSRRRCAR